MDLPNDCFLVPDGSLVSKNGEIVQYSVGRFVRDVCNGDCCFLCGRNSAGGGKLTDEHVLPKWLLSTGDIFNHTITLSNQAYHRYDRYKVKSCGRCNALLGETLEDPISTIFKGGFDAVSSYVRSEGPHLLYIWLSLVFFKTHLRDATLRWHLDRRCGRDYISNGYDWQSLHHVHCVARIPLTRALLGKNTCGSIWVLPATIGSPLGDFDYLDLYQSQSIAIRLDDFVIIGVLNDCFACANIENESLMPRVTGSLSPLQIREIYARVSYLNTRITNRPELYTAIRGNRLYITAKFPSTVTASQWEDREYGRLLDSTCGRLLVDGVEGPEQVKEVRDLLAEGKITFLFNDEGKFVQRDDL